MAIAHESDEALRERIATAYGMWGAFLSLVSESTGKALDDCAAHVGLKRGLDDHGKPIVV